MNNVKRTCGSLVQVQVPRKHGLPQDKACTILHFKYGRQIKFQVNMQAKMVTARTLVKELNVLFEIMKQ